MKKIEYYFNDYKKISPPKVFINSLTKKQKTPEKEINTALKILKQLLDR